MTFQPLGTFYYRMRNDETDTNLPAESRCFSSILINSLMLYKLPLLATFSLQRDSLSPHPFFLVSFPDASFLSQDRSAAARGKKWTSPSNQNSY